VIQYYLYNTYDEELRARFEKRFQTTQKEILDRVYKQPLAKQVPRFFCHFPGGEPGALYDREYY
jgi:glucosamine kinase